MGKKGKEETAGAGIKVSAAPAPKLIPNLNEARLLFSVASVRAASVQVNYLAPARVRVTFESSPPLKRYEKVLDLHAPVVPGRVLPPEVGPKNFTLRLLKERAVAWPQLGPGGATLEADTAEAEVEAPRPGTVRLGLASEVAEGEPKGEVEAAPKHEASNDAPQEEAKEDAANEDQDEADEADAGPGWKAKKNRRRGGGKKRNSKDDEDGKAPAAFDADALKQAVELLKSGRDSDTARAVGVLEAAVEAGSTFAALKLAYVYKARGELAGAVRNQLAALSHGPGGDFELKPELAAQLAQQVVTTLRGDPGLAAAHATRLRALSGAWPALAEFVTHEPAQPPAVPGAPLPRVKPTAAAPAATVRSTEPPSQSRTGPHGVVEYSLHVRTGGWTARVYLPWVRSLDQLCVHVREGEVLLGSPAGLDADPHGLDDRMTPGKWVWRLPLAPAAVRQAVRVRAAWSGAKHRLSLHAAALD